MGSLGGDEFVTEILDESQQSSTLRAVIQLLADKGVNKVNVEFGFVLERDLQGEKQGEDGMGPLEDFQSFIERGLAEGTIEWSGTSDFLFWPVGLEMKFLLCNDSDLHFASPDTALLLELSRSLQANGVKVYDHSGNLVGTDR